METSANEKPIVIAAFYRFVKLPDYQEMRWPLLAFCRRHGLKGTILLAEEGINSTICGTKEAVDALFIHFDEDERLKQMEHKCSYAEAMPFERMKVRLKQEIVRLGVEGIDAATQAGEYITSEEWDDFIRRDDVVVIDTRNTYETQMGTFEGAIDPRTRNFREFPEWAENWAQDKAKGELKVAMFCTGGIRCEKSTAYMKSIGFEQVYHLKGGILQYLEDKKGAPGTWQGDCFVFDERVAVNSALEPAPVPLCSECGNPLSAKCCLTK